MWLRIYITVASTVVYIQTANLPLLCVSVLIKCGAKHVADDLTDCTHVPAAAVRRYSSTQTANTVATAAADDDDDNDDNVPFIPLVL